MPSVTDAEKQDILLQIVLTRIRNNKISGHRKVDSKYEEQLCINGVTVTSMSRNKITILISQCSNLKTAETKALIDSGTKGKFIDGTIINWRNVIRLKKPITVRNVDGTYNEMGKICYKTKICYNMKQNQFEDWFYITKLGDQKVILGLPWLKQVNPDIDWSTGTVSFPKEQSINNEPEGEELEDDKTDMYLCTILKEEETRCRCQRRSRD